MKWLLDLFPAATEAFNNWRERKHELRLAKHELKKTQLENKAKIEAAKATAAIDLETKKLEGNLNWELLSIKNSGWKDEYVTILFTAPAVAIFIPGIQDYVKEGFIHLAETPMWYQMVLLAIVGSALGVRIWDGFFKPLMVGRKALNGQHDK